MEREFEDSVAIEEDSPLLNAETRPLLDNAETTHLDDAGEATHDDGVPTCFGYGPRRKPSVWYLAPPLFLFVLGGLMVFAPASQLMLSWVCDYMEMRNVTTPVNTTMTPIMLTRLPHVLHPHYPTHVWEDGDDKCNNPNVQATASLWFMVLGVCGSIPSLFAVPLYGVLSDRIGRKTIMLLPILGSTIHMCILIAVAHFKDQLIQADVLLPVLASAYVISGLFGSWSTLNMTVLSYIADTTTPDKRTVLIGRIEAVNFSAFVVGPLIGGFLVKATNSNITPFYFTLGFYVFVLFYVAIVVPDSKPPQRKPAEQEEKKSLKETFLAAKEILGGQNINRTLVTLIMFILQFKFAGTGFVFIMYTRLRFGWQAYEDGWYFFLTASFRVLSLAVMMPFVVRTLRKFGVVAYEVVMIRVGLLGFVASLSLYALAKSPYLFAASACLLDTPSFSLVLPTIRSLLSTSTSSSHQGRVFSAVAFIETTAGLISPLIFGPMYKYLVQRGIEHYVFWVCCGIACCAVAVSWFLKREPEKVIARQDTIVVDTEIVQ
jgi:MFS family permease